MIVLPQITPNLALQPAQRASVEPKASFSVPFANAVPNTTPTHSNGRMRNDAAQPLRGEPEPAPEDADRLASEEQTEEEAPIEDSGAEVSDGVVAGTPQSQSETEAKSQQATKDTPAARQGSRQPQLTESAAKEGGSSDGSDKALPEQSQKAQRQTGSPHFQEPSLNQQPVVREAAGNSSSNSSQSVRPSVAEGESQQIRTPGDQRQMAETTRVQQSASTPDQHPSDDSASSDDSRARARTILRAESASAEIAKPGAAFDAALQSSRTRPGVIGQDPTGQPAQTPPSMRTDSGAESPARDAAFAAGVSRGLAAALNQKGGTLTMLLNPASLGSLRIAMSIDAGSVSVTMEAVRPEAHELLNRNLQSLRTVLEARGLTVERMGVQLAPQSQNTDSSQSHQHNARNEDARSFGDRANAGGGESRGKREQPTERTNSDPEFTDDRTDGTTRFEHIRLALETVA